MRTTTFPRGELFVAGHWLQSGTGARRDVIDADGRLLTTVAEADAGDVVVAVRAAREAFDNGPWPRMSGRERARVLHRVADLIRERADELVAVESHHVGKPVTLCRAVGTEEVAGGGVQATIDAAMELDGAPKPVCIAQMAHRYYKD